MSMLKTDGHTHCIYVDTYYTLSLHYNAQYI